MHKTRLRGKSPKSSFRHAAFRVLRARVLIVTEGSKTEPNYFNGLINELGLTTAEVKIVGRGGSAPINVVNTAENILKKDEDYEHIYCVFDRDDHANYDQALAKVEALQKSRKFAAKTINAITSVPCFEFWFLLHLLETGKPYSNSREVISEIMKHDLTGKYKKGDCSVFLTQYSRKREAAKTRAARMLKSAEHASMRKHHENPSTRVHLVVVALEKISET